MRKLKLQMNMAVDGFVGGINGEQNWLEPNQDDEFKKHYQNDIIDSVDTLLMGRKMTEVFISYWENIVNNQPDNPVFLFAQKLVNIPKIVFSKTITTVAGKNITVENGDLVTEVNNLKNESGKGILVYGGANFVSSLIKNNLIDEFNLFIHPTAIGDGLKIFTNTTKLKLINSKSYKCGVVANQYKPGNG
jgi:dihydrofolate reductase